jgi:nitric oxide reductase NorD protein
MPSTQSLAKGPAVLHARPEPLDGGLLDCGFPEVVTVLDDCLREAQASLSEGSVPAYLEAGRFLGKMGRGPEPLLTFLDIWPAVAKLLGEDTLEAVMATVRHINKSPNGRAIAPFLQSLPAAARQLRSAQQLQHYLDLCVYTMEHSSGSIHGVHKTYASPGFPSFLEQAGPLLDLVSIDGLRAWAEYGVRNYAHHPDQQRAYFNCESADSRAVLQRERHGCLLVNHTRLLDLYLRALWQDDAPLVPYSTTWEPAIAQPYWDADGIRLPDVYDDRAGVPALDRYRLALAHMTGHKRWSQAIVGDNFSPPQRFAIECFEDARIDLLVQRSYPGLRHAMWALHPVPQESGCDSTTHSGFRHRLAILSRALLCPQHGYVDATLLDFEARFRAAMALGPSSTTEMVALALAYVARTRRPSDQFAVVDFTDTTVDYRDDNRHLWRFHELSDDEESFDTQRPRSATPEVHSLPARHYPEWDYRSQTFRPDWVSLYEGLHPSGAAETIDRLLEQHQALAKQLQRQLDLLKPQDRVRERYQEDGAELDLDMALRSLLDFKAGCLPDTRITQSHKTNGRSIAVTLLLDLSQSLSATVPGSQQTVLQLSQEAVALLGWAQQRLGDPFAIAGFHSNTRHDVRYLHIKGFDEAWDTPVKARLAAMQAGYSTRLGAAMRHAAHTLAAQPTDKKLLLVLTDGRPSDVDVPDEQLLVADARHSVQELGAQGISSYCISLDAQADAYVREIFGNHYTVIDRVAQLPEKLTRVFMTLTR